MTKETKSKVLTCPQCKKHLVLPAGRTQPESADMLVCPTHGEIGRYEDLIKDTAVGRSAMLLRAHSGQANFASPKGNDEGV